MTNATTQPTAPAGILERIDAEATIENWWAAIGGEPEYPATTETVLRLLQAQGFAVDWDTLHYLTLTQQFNVPNRWTAEDILLLAGTLHVKRMWQPHSDLWQCNVSRHERILQSAKEAGRLEEGRAWLCSFRYADLALMLLKSDDADTRERIYAHILAKLELEGLR